MHHMSPTLADRCVSRRRFLTTGAAVALLSVANRGGKAAEKGLNYRDLRSDKWLGEVEQVAKVADRKVFTEGPAVDRAGHVFFTNVPASKILRWDVKARRLSVFRENSHQANGLCFDP